MLLQLPFRQAFFLTSLPSTTASFSPHFLVSFSKDTTADTSSRYEPGVQKQENTILTPPERGQYRGGECRKEIQKTINTDARRLSYRPHCGRAVNGGKRNGK
uniref:Putative secreted protein n=1 Tax=Anopheles marajoara TaxID=58244 RepID=A0A2M4C8I8_9DIPT